MCSAIAWCGTSSTPSGNRRRPATRARAVRMASETHESSAPRSLLARIGGVGRRLRTWPRTHGRPARGILLGLVFLCGLTLFPRGEGFRPTVYKTNVAAPATVIAKFDFPIRKSPARLRTEREERMAAVAPVVQRIDSVKIAAFEELDDLRRTILDLRRNRLELDDPSGVPGALSQETYLTLFTQDAAEIFRAARERLRLLYDRGIVSATLAERLGRHEHVTVLAAGAERLSPSDQLASVEQIRAMAAIAPAGAERAIAELVGEFARPNTRFDQQATERARRLASDAVAANIGEVAKGDTLVEVRQVIDEEALRKLESYEAARAKRAPRLLLRERVLSYVGRAMILALALAALLLYVVSYRPELLASWEDTLLLGSMLGGFFLLGGLALNVLQLSPYLIPVAAFAVIIALLYEERLAFVSSVVLAATIGLVSRGGLDFIVVITLGAAAAILSVRRLRDRRQIYRLLLFVPLVHLAARGSLSLIHASPFAETLGDVLYLVANPWIATGIALFAVPLSESLFGKCTNLTLLELLDLNRPLLRRLMLEAPGTYHHSLMVGTLAEAGASAIDANPLLARVIGYHHDIGKTKKPEYFIENLMVGSRNPHDRLAPAMSRLILESHVRDGVLLARESKLPRAVQDGIAQHHGTGLMSYFYYKALRKDPTIPETEYRYPGPRPRTREAAVVLLSDQIDAAARSLEEPTPSRLRGLVTQLIEKRVSEGELDESSLTLRDLAELREAFIPILTALFHGRVSYPTLEPSRGRAATRSTAESAAKAEG
ncbi:MAG: HDIG domain-containing protein [Candidatus Eisenbacteria bacterium]|nr:HDIG domain-containing protein [Candidatus Eisenbacteria bacterium]